MHIVLKPFEKFITNVKCEKSRSALIGKYLFFILNIFYMHSSIGDKKVSLNRFSAETVTTLEKQTNYICTM